MATYNLDDAEIDAICDALNTAAQIFDRHAGTVEESARIVFRKTASDRRALVNRLLDDRRDHARNAPQPMNGTRFDDNGQEIAEGIDGDDDDAIADYIASGERRAVGER